MKILLNYLKPYKWLIALALLLAGGLALLLTRASLRPLETMRRSAEEVAATEEDNTLSHAESRSRIVEAIRKHYTAPA